jgi:kynurenine formamidase
MWSYRPDWKNNISTVSSTANNQSSTVYHFNVHSHTGTYIETSQHKLNNQLHLNDFPLDTFLGECYVVVIPTLKNNIVTLNAFLEELNNLNEPISKGAKLLIATGYGVNHKNPNYLSEAPAFEPALTQKLIEMELSLLAVDSPIIENQKHPYQPVIKLFTANEKLLILAPLLIDTKKIKTGLYTLSCFPGIKADISGSLCRAILMKDS